MKTLFTCFLLIVITGCVSNPETITEEVVVVRYKEPELVTVAHPEPSMTIKAKKTSNIVVYVPAKEAKGIVDAVEKDLLELIEDASLRNAVIATINKHAASQVQSHPSAYFSMDEKEYLSLADYFQVIKAGIASCKANERFYRGLNLTIPKETDSP